MTNEIEPVIGNWYRGDDENSFEVIALDDDSVEIQYFDGGIEELDTASWHELDIEEIEPPEDWSGPFDDLEKDDLGYTDLQQDEDELSGSDEGTP